MRGGSQRVRGSATKSGHAPGNTWSGGGCGENGRAEGVFGVNDPTQRPGQEAGGPPPGPPRFGEGEGGIGPGRRGGQSELEREVGRALQGSQDWPGAASSLCTLRIPVVQGRATARAPDTHPDLESFASKESGQLRHSD